MPRAKPQNLKVHVSPKVFHKIVADSIVYDVPPGVQFEAVVVSKFVGTLKALAFMEGVCGHFKITGLTVNNNVIPPMIHVERLTETKAWDIFDIPIRAGGAILLMVRNTSDRPRPFSFRISMEVLDEDHVYAPTAV